MSGTRTRSPSSKRRPSCKTSAVCLERSAMSTPEASSLGFSTVRQYRVQSERTGWEDVTEVQSGRLQARTVQPVACALEHRRSPKRIDPHSSPPPRPSQTIDREEQLHERTTDRIAEVTRSTRLDELGSCLPQNILEDRLLDIGDEPRKHVIERNAQEDTPLFPEVPQATPVFPEGPEATPSFPEVP